jgi:hypothetical protein
VEGQVSSWYVNPTLSDGTVVSPEVLEIAKELSEYRYGKELVLGGDFLIRAAIEALAFGDSFVELGIGKTGIGNNDWDIVSSQYLPTFSVFVEKTSSNQTVSYIQRTRVMPSEDDIQFNPVKILHFKYKSRGLYGNSIGFPSIETWRKFKECSVALETAARDVGITPWLHILPEDKTEQDRIDYMQRHESMSASGIITNLYLLSGSDVKKAAGTSGDSLAPLIDYWLKLRYQCIPPRVPAWIFPGLAESTGSRDIHGQPALTYSRLIGEVRSLIGEQVRWAICLKMVLRYGYDFYIANRHFDVKWPKWVLTPNSEYTQVMGEFASPTDIPTTTESPESYGN